MAKSESRAPKKGKPEKDQRALFRQTARELGCDESEEAFDAALKKIAKAPPPKDSKPKAKKFDR